MRTPHSSDHARLAHSIKTTLPKRFSALVPSPRTQGWIRPFCRLALANTASNIMVPLAGLIDTAFLGHLSEVRFLNGVALATVIFNVIYWGFNFFRMGTTGPTAQAVGKGNEADVWLIGVRNTLLALGAGISVWILQKPISALGFALLQASPGVREAAITFFNGRIVGAPAVLVNLVLLGWLLGRSKGRAVIVLAIISNSSNIVLDYWFIKQLGWGSYGAGLATALSQYILLATGLVVIFSGSVVASHPLQSLTTSSAAVFVRAQSGHSYSHLCPCHFYFAVYKFEFGLG